MSELAKNLNEIVLSIEYDLDFHEKGWEPHGVKDDYIVRLPAKYPTRGELKAWVSVLNEDIRMAKETGKVEV